MKKQAFIQLSRATWKQNDFREIVSFGPETAISALYVISAPNGNMTGVFEMTIFDLQRHTALTLEQATQSIHNLCEIGFCEYDFSNQYIWEKGSMKRHLGKSPSSQQLKGIINNFIRLQEEDAPFVIEAFNCFTETFPGAKQFAEALVDDRQLNTS